MVEQIGGMWDYAAYIPCYDGGNSVMAVKKSGQTVMLDKGIKSVIRMLLRESSMDINAFRRNFNGSSGKFNLIPIPLSLETVLMPLKVRRAIGKNDGAYAYVDVSSIKEVSGARKSTVTLHCGMEIACIESARSIRRRMQVANLVRLEYTFRVRGETKLGNEMLKIITEYGKLAGIMDVVTLILDILRIRRREG